MDSGTVDMVDIDGGPVHKSKVTTKTFTMMMMRTLNCKVCHCGVADNCDYTYSLVVLSHCKPEHDKQANFTCSFKTTEFYNFKELPEVKAEV